MGCRNLVISNKVSQGTEVVELPRQRCNIGERSLFSLANPLKSIEDEVKSAASAGTASPGCSSINMLSRQPSFIAGAQSNKSSRFWKGLD